LENRESKNNEMSRGMWETVETSAREIRVGKAEEGRSKRKSREKERREKEEEETEKGKDNKIAKEWEIWDEEEEAAKSEVEAKKMVPEKFHK